MTLEKAIGILEDDVYSNKITTNRDFKDAEKLGIEALKFYLASSHFACGCLLPGQTRETEE